MKNHYGTRARSPPDMRAIINVNISNQPIK